MDVVQQKRGKYYSIDGAKIYDPVEHAKMVESKNWMSNETETMFEVLEKRRVEKRIQALWEPMQQKV
jgi:hypothetical protein